MTIDQAKVIDLVSKDQIGNFVLTICDHFGWDNTGEHLALLQDKINAYLMFLESGEIYEKYPDAKGHRIEIEAMFVHKPNSEALSFLAKTRLIIENIGFSFRYDRLLTVETEQKPKE